MGDGRTYANVVAIRAVTIRGRHDRRLGEAAVRRPGQDQSAASSTRSPASTGSSTTSAPSRPPRSSGSERLAGYRVDPGPMGYSGRATCAVAFAPWSTTRRPRPGRPTPSARGAPPPIRRRSRDLPVLRRDARGRPTTDPTLPGLTAIDAAAIVRAKTPMPAPAQPAPVVDQRRVPRRADARPPTPARSPRPTSRSGARCSGSSSRPRSPTSRPRPTRSIAEATVEGRVGDRPRTPRRGRGRRRGTLEAEPCDVAEAWHRGRCRRGRDGRRDADAARPTDAADDAEPPRRRRGLHEAGPTA